MDAAADAVFQGGNRPAPQTETSPNAWWRTLLHRWLIEYNPLYLLSAALVLTGVILLSEGIAHRPTLLGKLGVAGIAEIYSWLLIAGAAALTRAGLRRPAVMLALLAVLYQGDLTLHTETCTYLGAAGGCAAVVWLVSFIAKLRVIAWAVRVRLSASAVGVPTLGAFGLALLPQWFHHVDVHVMTWLAAVWGFAVFGAGLWTARRVQSEAYLDDWGTTVLRRSLWASWGIWAGLLLIHVAFWASEGRIMLLPLVPVAGLLATRWIKHELPVWLTVAASLGVAALLAPWFLWIASMLAGATLLIRTRRYVRKVAPTSAERTPSSPYRTPAPEAEPRSCPLPRRVQFVAAPKQETLRLYYGALFALYLALATAPWTLGTWAGHSIALDVALTAATVVFVWRWRAVSAVLGPIAVWVHLAGRSGLVSAPETRAEWGVTAVVLGVVLLVGSVGATLALRHTRDAAKERRG
jgi:hypothetical protein